MKPAILQLQLFIANFLIALVLGASAQTPDVVRSNYVGYVVSVENGRVWLRNEGAVDLLSLDNEKHRLMRLYSTMEVRCEPGASIRLQLKWGEVTNIVSTNWTRLPNSLYKRSRQEIEEVIVPAGAVSHNQLGEVTESAVIGAAVGVVLPREAITERPYNRVFVLSIGANKNPALGDLKYADRDAEAVAKVFREVYGFSEVKTLLGEEATLPAIEYELSRIDQEISEGRVDDVIVFFSGHSATLQEKKVVNRKDKIISHGFLIPFGDGITEKSELTDFQKNAIEMEWLVNELATMPARHGILLIDSCLSGLAFNVQPVTVKPPDDVYEEVIRQPTVQIMTAGLDSERALDVDSVEIRQGLFTYALLKQLRESGVRSVEEVFFPLRAEVRNQVAILGSDTTMTPQHRYLKQEGDGTFVFVTQDRWESWAGQSASSGVGIAAAKERGFYRPVQDDEIDELRNTPPEGAGSDLEWNARVERYEARAALGDPKAMASLAEVYGRGVGVRQDSRRSNMWATEAGHTLGVAGLFGIDEAPTIALVDTFVNVDAGPGPNFGKAGSPENEGFGNPFVGRINRIGGAFKKDGAIGSLFRKKGAGEKWEKKISDRPDDVFKYLNRTKPNFNTALKRVASWEEELRESQEDLPGVGADLVEELSELLKTLASQLRQQKSQEAIQTLEKARGINGHLGELYLAQD